MGTSLKILMFMALFWCLISCSEGPNDVVVDDFVSYGHGDIIDGKYIVVFKDDGDGLRYANTDMDYKGLLGKVKEDAVYTFSRFGIDESQIYTVYAKLLYGVAVTLTDIEFARLSIAPEVKSIEPDRYVSLGPIPGKGKPGGGSNNSSGGAGQAMPWGIDRIGGAGNGAGKTAWIIDTGIDMDHPDLNVDAARSASFLTMGGPNSLLPNDENGHGTHVAGTIAAINNSIGVVGVAAGAQVVAVRVLDKRGSGTVSGVIAGVDYVAANGNIGDVANMSLGGGVSPTLDQAVINAAATGVKFAIAAGNSSSYAGNYSPARANGANIYTVSAMDSKDIFASFSNYGNPPIDYCAPGVAILSTWKDAGYKTISGTSMATPHVAGILLLGSITTDGYVINDPDGNPDQIAHR